MIDARLVHETLAKHQLADGMDIVLDLEKSHGSWVHDARTGEEYLDDFTCFASWPLGYNHPMMLDEPFVRELTQAALINPSNSDLYTREMATFVDAFATGVTPPDYPHHFWVSGGALAVENALKVAFDWKARKLGRTSFEDDVNDLIVMHFTRAFHGRSGYTLSLTNTLPDKIGLFPKFGWPRISAPKMEVDLEGNVINDVEAEERQAYTEIETFFSRCPAGGNKVAAIIIEPMQGEGGDCHFRPEFLAKLRQYADEHECLLIFDEVQTGFYGTGKPWMWQVHGVKPDVVAFGKKTQVCGLYANGRIDEVRDNVFERSSRINSTWGGILVNMVRCRRFIEIIDAENVADNIARMGEQVIAGLRAIAKESGAFRNVRGIGSLIAFTLDDDHQRKQMLKALHDQKVLALPTGKQSVRFRLPLIITEDEVRILLERTAAAAHQLTGATEEMFVTSE
jgi:L-lysine 6-transaminase